MFRAQTNLKPAQEFSSVKRALHPGSQASRLQVPLGRRDACDPRFIQRVALLGAFLGALSWMPAGQGQVDPHYREWRQRLAATSRLLLYRNIQNPFQQAPELEGQEQQESEADYLERPSENPPNEAETEGETASTSGPETTSMPSDRLADWDWRERFRWFQTWGSSTRSATETESDSGSTQIQPSTSSYWWFQNPFSAP